MKKILSVAGILALIGKAALAAPNGNGPSVVACNQLVVTASSSYGINYIVGGTQKFSNLLQQGIGSGVLQSIVVKIADNETGGFTFWPLGGVVPAGTGFTDNQVAAITGTDVTKAGAPIALSASSQLAATGFTVAYAYGLGLVISPGKDFYGVLVANAALSTQFAGASDVMVCIGVLQDSAVN